MARLFDGIDDGIVVSDNTGLDGNSAGTISILFKTTYKATFQKLLFKNVCIDIGLTQDYGGGAKIFGEIGGVGNLGTIEEFNAADGNWHNAIFRWDGTNLKGFRDGVEKNTMSATTSQTDNANALYIGERAGSEYFNGDIAEVAIWSKALTDGEVFAVGAKRFSASFFLNSLELYIPMIGRNSPETDIVGNNSGTVTGTTASVHPHIIYPSSTRNRRFTTAAGAATSVKDLIGMGIIPFAR